MKKLALLVVLLATACTPNPATASDLTVVVGTEYFTRDQPTTLEEALKVLEGENAILNQVISSYMSDSDNAESQVTQIMAGVSSASSDLKKSDTKLDKIAASPPSKFLYAGGFVAFNPALSSSQFFFDLGPKIGINLFNTMLLGGGIGIHVAPNTLTPILELDASWWVL
jgi:hypothetical protein